MWGLGNVLKGVWAQLNPFDGGENYRTYNPEKKKREEQSSFSPATSSAPRSSSQLTAQTPMQQQQQAQPKVERPQNVFSDVSSSLKLPGNKSSEVARAQKILREGGSATPFRSEIIDAAKKANDLEQQKKKPSMGNLNLPNSKYNQSLDMRRMVSVPRKPAPAPKKNEPNFLQKIGAGFQQALGRATDAAVQGGGALTATGTQLNPFLSKEQKERQVKRDIEAAESLRRGINSWRDITGNQIVGNRDVEDAAGRIAAGRGTPQDLASIAGRGLDVAGTTTMFINPARTFSGAAAANGVRTPTVQALRQILPNVAREASLYGGVEGTQATLDKYGQTGDILEAAKEFAPSFALGAGSQLGLEGAAFAGGRAMRNVAGRSPFVRSVERASEDGVRFAQQPATEALQIPVGEPNRVNVQQPREISVRDLGNEVEIPVNNNQTGRPIREVSGDTPGRNQAPTANDRAADRFANQPRPTQDQLIEDVSPFDTGNTGLFTRAEIEAEQRALDKAFVNDEIDAAAYKETSDKLSELRAIDDVPPKGKKIEVKEVKNIPVEDRVDVPVDIPDTPGTVRVTEAVSPNAARTERAAQNAVVVPREVQDVLDNPKQFTKRQVASARNQAKLAKQMAKTQEQTAESLSRIQSASPAAQSSEGFVPTGEFAKSINGGAYQKANRSAEMAQAVQETSNIAPNEVIRTARANQGETGGFNRRDIRNIAALFETKRLQRGTPEYNEARQILKEDGTIWGQTGALRNYTMRRNASADELTSRFESKLYRLADDPSKIDSRAFDEIEVAETRFVEARDAATDAYNRFTESPTSANAKTYNTAQDAFEKADKEAKIAEYRVATQALKGNKDIQQARELEKMAQTADMYQMDAVDASMLSGTGTFARNFVNAAVSGVEEGLFGRLGARAAGKFTGESVGGGLGRGTVKGFKEGVRNTVDASKARAGVAGKNPLEHLKNWATTGNQLGDTVIDSQVRRSVTDHYTQLLKKEGYKGRELRDRAGVMSRQDPNGVAEEYATVTRVAAGLGSGVTRNNKIETTVKNIISDAMSGGKPNKVTENAAKLITRMTIGFPTAIGRSVGEGGKRFILGAPTFIKAIREADPQAKAILTKEAIKQAGSGGLVIPSLFYALGASGAITGGYPDDPAERERWKREGISENSIKIGDDYYQLPAYLGSWAIPGLFYASLGRNNGDFQTAAVDAAKIAPNLLPTDQITNVTDFLYGRSDPGKFISQTGASAVRAATPGGALLSQIAKTLDSSQNDTNSGNVMENLVSKVLNGIPVASMSLPGKTDDQGNILSNPDPLSLALGASSTEQKQGLEQSAALTQQANDTVKQLGDFGAFSDPNIRAVITDDDTKKIYESVVNGEDVQPEEIEKLQKAMVKGVSETGSDTVYLENEQYDSNLTALQLKRSLMKGDPTTKPSELKKMDVAIKRGEIYRDNEIPYDLIKGYQDTSLTEWRAMGNSDSDDYNPEMYETLWAIDELMTKGKVSDNYKGKMDENKYSGKKSGGRGGRGGGRGRAAARKILSSEFGTLGQLRGAPTVQQYKTLDQQSGNIPVIQVERPNIVHKISSS